MTDHRFDLAAAAVSTLAMVVAFAGVFLSPVDAFRGSITTSALVGFVFAAYNLQSVRATGVPRFATSVVVTVFGLWFVAGPLTYDPQSFAATATVQFSGLVAAAFAGHLALDALARLVRGGQPRDGVEQL
jgi:hypothetical protein